MHSRFLHISFPRKTTDHDRIIAEAAMEKCDVWQYGYKNVSHLSGGQAQWVCITRCIALQTDDMPIAGFE
ncbi:hypothetical protein LJB89_02620 [Tyzzerella sp. OttesenSCG-928-J15]|nr:hypothetical protein [Tyzzerella sp. OttesenSCG-928-J15]